MTKAQFVNKAFRLYEKNNAFSIQTSSFVLTYRLDDLELHLILLAWPPNSLN